MRRWEGLIARPNVFPAHRARAYTSLVGPRSFSFPLRFDSPDDVLHRATQHRLGRRGKAASFHPLAGGFADAEFQ